jgi:glyoxylase-like metal-dependent hydrolase (beta-lactamase superfamily II)
MSGATIPEVDCLTVGPFQENTFFVRAPGSRDVVIIDPGEEAARLMALIESHNWKPVAIINTHAHLDHVGAVVPLQEHYQIPFYLHENEQPVLEAAPEAARLYGVRVPDIPKVDQHLPEGEMLELAGLKFQVLFTPGHTPGHVAFVLDDRVIAGDVLFNGSIGRTDLPGGHTETLLLSIRDKLLPLPDEFIVHCGHGPDTTIGLERASNPFLQDLGRWECAE